MIVYSETKLRGFAKSLLHEHAWGERKLRHCYHYRIADDELDAAVRLGAKVYIRPWVCMEE